MEFRIADTFTDRLARLTAEVRARDYLLVTSVEPANPLYRKPIISAADLEPPPLSSLPAIPFRKCSPTCNDWKSCA